MVKGLPVVGAGSVVGVGSGVGDGSVTPGDGEGVGLTVGEEPSPPQAMARATSRAARVRLVRSPLGDVASLPLRLLERPLAIRHYRSVPITIPIPSKYTFRPP